MADEPRRSVRATKGQHTKSLDLLDQTSEPTKKRASKKAAAKKAASQEVASGAEEDEIIRCICGVTEQDDESDEDWIACDTCSAWQHNVCMGVTTDKAALEDLHYWCEQCRPENHKELLDAIARGEKPWEERRKAHEQAQNELQKSKKGKKGKGKRTSDPKTEPEQNGKAKTPEAPTDVKKEKKKDSVGRVGSTKRKTRDEPLEEPSKTKVRKVSTPQPKQAAQQSVAPASIPSPAPASTTVSATVSVPPPADIPATIEGLDKRRQGVAKYLNKNLHFAMKNAQKNGIYKATDTELDQKALRLALEIERATFDTHPDISSYGTQARKVASNLKTNQELCDGLLSGTLAPSRLAVMTDDEMATKELQRQTAEMKARADKQSIMLTDDGPRIRRTHKGDEIIEQDNFAAPSEEMPVARRRSMLDPNSGIGAQSRENSPGNQDELPQDIDEYRPQDDLRSNSIPSHPLTVDTQATPPERKASIQTPDFDINKVFSSVKSPTAAQHARKPSGQSIPRAGPGDDPEIDKLLEDENDTPPYSPTADNTDEKAVWRGTLNMTTVANFTAVARHVGGADPTVIEGGKISWDDLIPHRLQVAGRISQEKANQYLCGLRYSQATDVVIVTLTPSSEAASSEFMKLFDYFHSKNMYGVVGNKGIANVRDTYLVPVPAGANAIPEFMLNLEYNELATDRPEPVILVALVIRHEIVLQADGSASPSGVVNHAQRQMSLGGSSGPAMSPINPQGSFQSPSTPQNYTPVPHTGGVDHQQLDALRRERTEAQARGEVVATQILGTFVTAPTVSFLMPQAYQMQPSEWNIIREIFEQEPKAREDLTFLSQLLEKRNGPNGSNIPNNPNPKAPLTAPQ